MRTQHSGGSGGEHTTQLSRARVHMHTQHTQHRHTRRVQTAFNCLKSGFRTCRLCVGLAFVVLEQLAIETKPSLLPILHQVTLLAQRALHRHVTPSFHNTDTTTPRLFYFPLPIYLASLVVCTARTNQLQWQWRWRASEVQLRSEICLFVRLLFGHKHFTIIKQYILSFCDFRIFVD